MHINYTGSGSPTVIMDSGLGGTSLDWARIQPQIVRYTRLCAYDHSGYGWSDSGTDARTNATIMNELRMLLDAAEESGPFVLAGNFFGGFKSRLFASAYQNHVTGLVLIDTSHELLFKRLEAIDSGFSLAPRRGGFVMISAPTTPAELPQHLPPIASAWMSPYASLDEVRGELAALRQSAAQVARHHWLPEVAFVVFTRGLRVYPDTAEGGFKEAIWRELQKDMAGRSNRSVHQIARYNGHYIPLEQPEGVVNVICIAAETARAGNPSRSLPCV